MAKVSSEIPRGEVLAYTRRPLHYFSIFMVSRAKSERDRKEMLRNLRSYLLVALLIALYALSKFTKITDGLEKYYEMAEEAEKVMKP